MTVSSTTREPGPFSGNDVTTSFPFTFKVFVEEDVELVHEDADGVQTALVLDSDYSVSLNADQDNNPGGTITYPVSGDPLPTGEKLYAVGATAYTQTAAITNLGNYQPRVQENAFDRCVVLIQQVLAKMNRALKFPVGDAASTVLPTAAERAGGSLAFDADGNPIAGPALGDLQAELDAAAAQATIATTQAGIATTKAEEASDSAVAAAGSASTAGDHADDAAASLQLVLSAADIYADDTAGLAATASGSYYGRLSSNADESVVIVLDNAGVAVDKKALPSASAWRDELLAAAYARAMETKRLRREQLQRPKAAVVILLGQSNNAPRNTSISGTVSDRAFMPVSGNSISLFAFSSTNVEHTTHWNDLASVVTHAEGSLETPCSGVILGLLGGPYDRIYACSVAIGARSLDTLKKEGPANNLYAVVHRLCDIARAAGYEPEVLFDTFHGETDMSNSATESDYYSDGWEYYRRCQAVAAQAMERPDYDAPILFHNPIYMALGTPSYDVHAAITRLANDIPNAILDDGVYTDGGESDRTHQPATGFRMRGERSGRYLRDFMQKGQRHLPVKLIDAKRTTTTLTLTFNQEVTIDTNFTYGSNLNTSYALYGIEFLYDGTSTTYTPITAAVAQGHQVICTLASDPGAHAATEQVRVAMQATTGALTPGDNNRSGTLIRSNVDTGFLSIYDYTRRNYLFAPPQRLAVR